MSDAQQTAPAASKSKTVYTEVVLTDGTKEQFAGKRKVNKSTIIDPALIEQAGDTLQLQAGAVKVRMAFRNGEVRLIPLNLALLAQYAGHGGEQKFGDELAAPADKPLSEDDMVLAIDELAALHAKGQWGVGRAEGGGGVSGASVVIKALMEYLDKPVDVVKAYIEKRIEGTPGLTRQALYASFRAGDTPIKVIIERMESEKAAKESKLDAGAELDAMKAAT